MPIALVTCRVLPDPDPEQAPLLAALKGAGAPAVAAAWDDPAVDWGRFDALVLRSTWDYHRHLEAFLAWLERAAAAAPLWNPPEVVRWNAHKRYLLDLEERGFPVVATELVPRGAEARLADVLARREWDEAVVKPAVSAGSRDTLRVGPSTLEAGQAHLDRLLAREDVLVQGYVASVEDYGERSLVWIDGELTHAVRKRPRFAGEPEGVEGPLPIPPDEAELARALLAAAAPGALYGRVDLARDESGRPRLMELELIEPSLFVHLHPPALARFTAALAGLPQRSP